MFFQSRNDAGVNWKLFLILLWVFKYLIFVPNSQIAHQFVNKAKHMMIRLTVIYKYIFCVSLLLYVFSPTFHRALFIELGISTNPIKFACHGLYEIKFACHRILSGICARPIKGFCHEMNFWLKVSEIKSVRVPSKC